MTATSKSHRALPVAAILAAGVGMGFAGDHLLRVPGDPGLNFFLLFLCLAASVWAVSHTGGSPLSRESSTWLGVGLLCAAALVWRGSGLLRFGAFVAACAAFALPALYAGSAWVRRAGVLEVVEALAGSGLHSAFGSLRLFRREHWAEVGKDTPRGAVQAVMRSGAGGAILALAPLVIFGSLFVSADQMFATILGDFVNVDLQAFTSHLVLIAVLSWLTCGYLVGVSWGTRLESVRRVARARPTLGIAEVATALGLVDLLFLGFVIVQFRYLFGGGAWVEVTPGLTYATYARTGFFQLVAAVALAIPWLLVTHALLGERSPKARSVFRGFAGLHILLLLVIVGSAIQRMLIYQSAYGLTELRVVVTAVLVWLTVVVIWFGATVLRGHGDRFAFGALATAFVLIGALQVVNPAGWVARHNLDRVSALAAMDVHYLSSLGSDAAPILVSRLDELPLGARCWVAGQLLRRWGPSQPSDWRSFNVSEMRAREAVEEQSEALETLAGSAESNCTWGHQ